MYEQQPFGTDDFAENPEPRCPCLLLLDNSGSMRGEPLTELNAGLREFQEALRSDALATKRVEISIVSFGPVKIHHSFEGAGYWEPPTLTAQADTPMGSAIEQGLDILEGRKAEYRANGIAFYRPWVFLITDGAPTDTWEDAARRVHEGESSKSFVFFSVGVQGARMDILRKISPPNRDPLKLKGLAFRELFQWLSNSMRSVSHSSPDDDVSLDDPTGPKGWGSV